MQRRVLLEVDVERYQAYAPPNAFVRSHNLWLVLGGEPQFQLRLELKRLLEFEAGAYGIAARELLNQRFRQLLTLLPFGRAHKPCAPQLGDVRIRPGLHAPFLGDKSVEVRRLAVGSENMAQNLDESGLSVAAVAPEDEQALLNGQARHAVTHGTLEEISHFPAAVHDLHYKPFPPGAEGIQRIGYGRAVGQQIVGIVRLQYEGCEVQGARSTVEKIGVPVEGINQDADLAVRFRHADHRLELGASFAGVAPFAYRFPDLLVRRRGAFHEHDFPRDAFSGFVGRLVDLPRFVQRPVGIRPVQPARGTGEAELVTVAYDQPTHVAKVVVSEVDGCRRKPVEFVHLPHDDCQGAFFAKSGENGGGRFAALLARRRGFTVTGHG